MKKLLLFSILAFALLFTACGGEPTPLSPEILTGLNCQPGDLPKNQTYELIEGRPPPNRIFTGGEPYVSSTVAYNDTSSTHQSFSCSVFVFSDPNAVAVAHQRACDEIDFPIDFFRIGKQVACQGGDSEVILSFYKGNALVWIWADNNGEGIESVARIMEDRLTEIEDAPHPP
jgi:hypothetical protein